MIEVIKSEVAKNKEETLDLPLLMVNNQTGMIVLVTELNKDDLNSVCGVLISGHWSHKTGYFSKLWARDNFRPYDGEITLKNKLD